MSISQREKLLIELAKRILDEALESIEEPEIKKNAADQPRSRHILRRLRKMSGI